MKNAGILSALHPRRAAYCPRPKPRPRPSFHLRWVALTLGLCAMCSSYAYSVRPASQVIEHLVPVSTCTPLSRLQPAHYQGSKLFAAAIPATALQQTILRHK